MDATTLEAIRTALAANDLESLRALAVPAGRTPRRGSGFHAPLMLSAHNLKHLLKIESLPADCIMLNLEDGVSAEQKPFALVLAAIFLSELRDCGKKLVVRVNPFDEGGDEEIAYLNAFGPDAIRVPKVRGAEDVRRVLDVLDDAIDLHLSVETAAAWNALSELAVEPRVRVFYLGILDLFADMGLPQSLITPENPTMRYILAHFLVTCRALGVEPVSFVYQEYRNMERFDTWLGLERSMGYRAKGCLSPDQAAAAMEAFADSEAEIARAKHIVARFEAERARGVTGFTDEAYGFIDEPIYKGALALLEAAGR